MRATWPTRLILLAFVIIIVRSTCLVHLILLDFIVLIIFGEDAVSPLRLVRSAVLRITT
jgi:hypothetical protein